MAVPILKQGPYLIASIQSALTDTDVLRLQDDVMDQVGRFRSRGHHRRRHGARRDGLVRRRARCAAIAHMTRLRGAETVIVGIQPEVAFAMVQLGMKFEDVHTALDLEEGLAFLQSISKEPDDGGGEAFRVAITTDADVVTARQQARSMGGELGLQLAPTSRCSPPRSPRWPATSPPTRARARCACASCAAPTAAQGIEVDRPATRARASPTSSCALQDGYTTGNGLGLGLPGARRLVDEFELRDGARAGHDRAAGQVGPCVAAEDQRWPAALERGVAAAPSCGREPLGRSRRVRGVGRRRAGVRAIDGLGHGDRGGRWRPRRRPRVLGEHPREAPEALLARCHEALVRTRGVVMTLAWFDLGVGDAHVDRGRQRRGPACARVRRAGRRARGRADQGRRRRLQRCPTCGRRPPSSAPATRVVLATDGIVVGLRQLARAGRRRAAARRPHPGRARRAAPTTRWSSWCARSFRERCGSLPKPTWRRAMRAGRLLAAEAGLSLVEAQHLATAVSEVATNAWRYARGGEVELEPVEHEGRRGVRVVVRDRGPGIADVAAALSRRPVHRRQPRRRPAGRAAPDGRLRAALGDRRGDGRHDGEVGRRARARGRALDARPGAGRHPLRAALPQRRAAGRRGRCARGVRGGHLPGAGVARAHRAPRRLPRPPSARAAARRSRSRR